MDKGSEDKMLKELNPNEIESINVLKRDTLSQFFCERNIYGIILITTKKAEKKLDFDFSEPDQSSSLSLKIFPNPSQNHLAISSENENYIQQIKVFDWNGKTILEKAFNQSTLQVKEPIANWKTGIYIIEITTASGVSRKHFIKE
ncbi:T9SS type A sorting domain-containing protein [Limibacter armeniacum]|uniref:T9SS type A sorting domain-containing protein n=1 Tax=Limibacter armeniacum TaxID=466084 RepID=UPI002FE51C56